MRACSCLPKVQIPEKTESPLCFSAYLAFYPPSCPPPQCRRKQSFSCPRFILANAFLSYFLHIWKNSHLKDDFTRIAPPTITKLAPAPPPHPGSGKLEKNLEREMTQNPKPKSVSEEIGGPGQQGPIWFKHL